MAMRSRSYVSNSPWEDRRSTMSSADVSQLTKLGKRLTAGQDVWRVDDDRTDCGRKSRDDADFGSS
jgi:hypothetical protein